MPNPGPGRRGVVAGGIITLLLVAFGVFVLPFAFTTPPPIVTRFTATRLFSPGSTEGRGAARVSIRLSQPSNVLITIKDPSGTVVRTLSNNTLVTTKTLSIPWDGTGEAGNRLPDGNYTIDLNANAGQKKFRKSRRVVLDTQISGVPALAVTATTAACTAVVTGPNEPTRLQVAAVGTGVQSTPVNLAAGGTSTWVWRRARQNGTAVKRATILAATVRDAAGNTATVRAACPGVAAQPSTGAVRP